MWWWACRGEAYWEGGGGRCSSRRGSGLQVASGACRPRRAWSGAMGKLLPGRLWVGPLEPPWPPWALFPHLDSGGKDTTFPGAVNEAE